MTVTRLTLDLRGGVTVGALLGALVEAGASVTRIERDLGSLGPGAVPIALRSSDRGSVVRLHAPPGTPVTRPWGQQRDRMALLAVDGDVAAVALTTLELLARARGVAHGIPLEDVEPDPWGGLDETAGALALASALASLGGPVVRSTAVGVGSGTARTAVGRLDLPGPVVRALLGRRRTRALDLAADVVEPLAAAFVVAVSTELPLEDELELEQAVAHSRRRDGTTGRGLLTTVDGEAGVVLAVAV